MGSSQPNAKVVPWSSGLFDCCDDVPVCCLTWWCPCITFGQISEIVDKGQSSCACNGALYALLYLAFSLTRWPCLVGLYSFRYRSKLREQYMLEEELCDDCLVHLFCGRCALCQEYRELKGRGFDMSIGWEGNRESENGGVTMPPNAQGGMNR